MVIHLFVFDLWFSDMLYAMENDRENAYNHNDLMASW